MIGNVSLKYLSLLVTIGLFVAMYGFGSFMYTGFCTAPSCLDQTLASGRLLGEPGFTGFLRCAPA
jgi:hypothetical protein